MDFENQQWDQADQDLNNWLNGSKDENHVSPSNLFKTTYVKFREKHDEVKPDNPVPLTEILKSIYLTFRKKQNERLSQFCKLAFENYEEQEKIKSEIIHESNFRDTEIRFRIAELSESELRDRTNKENQRIIKGLQSGNQQVYNDLYEYELPKVKNLIIQNSGSIDNAKDIFQDAIVILLEKINSNSLNLNSSIKNYLYSICKYRWLYQLRQNKKEKQMIKLFDEWDYETDISICDYNAPDIFEDISAEINNLGDSCQRLLECYYFKFMSWDEIASTLGYSNAASARNQKYKCLARIRSTLTNHS